jgi:hypothetical protein
VKSQILLAAATALLAVTAAHAAPMYSKYTSLTGCRMLYNAAHDPAADMKDVFESICPGRDGLRVTLGGFDGRTFIGLLPAGAAYKHASNSTMVLYSSQGSPARCWNGVTTVQGWSP